MESYYIQNLIKNKYKKSTFWIAPAKVESLSGDIV